MDISSKCFTDQMETIVDKVDKTVWCYICSILVYKSNSPNLFFISSRVLNMHISNANND